MSPLLFGAGGACVIVYCVLVRVRLFPRQRIPGHYRAVAWLGIVMMFAAVLWAIGDVLRS